MRSLILVAFLAFIGLAAAQITPVTLANINGTNPNPALYNRWAGSCYQKAAYVLDANGNDRGISCIPNDLTIVNEYQIRYFPNFQQRFQAYGARENFTVAGLTYYLQPEVFPAPGVASSNFTLFNGTAGLLGTNNGTFQFQPCYFVGFITGANGAVTMYEFGEYNTRNYTAVRTCPSPGEFNTKALRCDANTFTYYCEVVLHVPSPDDDSANGVFVSIATVLAFVLAALLF